MDIRVEVNVLRETEQSRPAEERASDEQLAVRAREEREAFICLYGRYVERIERFVAARTGAADVEDTVSAIFLRALDRIHTYRPDRGTFASWLFTIARHAVVDTYRQQRAPIVLDPSCAEDSVPSPESEAIRAETQAGVRRALRTLTRDQQDALALRFAADLPFADVARALGKSEPAAKMLVRRGLDALRAALEAST